MSSLARKAFGVGGRVLLIELRERVGDDSGDLMCEVFSGVGRRGLRAGRGMGDEEGAMLV